jgi:branched-chain amino acid transport system substrate-binding protein
MRRGLLRVRRLAVWGCLLGASAFAVACGGGDDDSGSSSSSSSGGGGGKTLNVYSSLPLQGASRPQSEDVINGEKLALKQRGNKAGEFNINYISLDDATAAAGQWDPGQTTANARKVAQDKNAIALLGEFNSGASVLSIPITNEAGILQVSPSNTRFGLTKAGSGAEKGEPDKYYPSGKRNFARVVPIDTIQGAALAQWMKDEGVKSVYLLNDKQVYGQGVSKNTEAALGPAGIKVAGRDGWDGKASNFRALADKIKASGADAVFTGGILQNNGPQLYKDLSAAMPNAKLFGPDGFTDETFTKELPAAVQAQTYLTVPTVSPEELPPDGQKFYKDYEVAYGKKASEVAPYAVYGYEAMLDVLDAIAKGGDDRQAVIDAMFATKKTDSVFGPYEIDDDGDTTLTTYGAYRVKDGKLVFDRVIKGSGS